MYCPVIRTLGWHDYISLFSNTYKLYVRINNPLPKTVGIVVVTIAVYMYLILL